MTTLADRSTARTDPSTVAPRRRAATGRAPWEEPPTRIGSAAKGGTLTVLLVVFLVPLYTVVLTSFSTQQSINAAGGLVLVPGGVTLDAYREIISGGVVTRALFVSLGVTAVGTAISTVVTILAAYGLSRSRSFGHRTILMLMIVTMFFGAGIIPTYLVVTGLGMYNSYWALILPSAVSVFNILVMRSFFVNLGQDVIDSARVDGAGDWRIVRSVVLPMSRAVTAVIALFYAVGYWNSFFNVMLYIQDNSRWTLQFVLYNYVTLGFAAPNAGITGVGSVNGQTQVATLSLQMAVVVLTLVPILVVYPFVQRHFTKGMLTGAIKG
jgi:multiple sugar transport system permease protein/putative aldouronate transport system permease protein